ncbi:putative Alpha-glucosidase [Glarea lozoyensis 74030]|uniref:Putative Alpha-glucosidase n=1 Tax=Glarea lozoyensis (strain ATCC 74030 / MF5533) TaxID=1104152 RepID=H0EVF9_GLAL7|nr:putative Alpha-glucosidase [Glarea lozoyensis 74030]
MTSSSPTQTSIHRTWWKESTVYQIYPSSFFDSDADGLGDIPGIISKLDYIAALGIDVHEWFKESKKGKDNPYRDYYIWRKGKTLEDGTKAPPNNWGAIWGGSAWVYDEPSDEYYLHIFAPEQPDLNWEHPSVRDAVYDIMTFWLDKGVDGFRMDVINFISKVPGLPDAPITRKDQEFQPGNKFYACGPRLHEWLKEIGQILKKYNAFSVGEMPAVHDPKELIKAVGQDRGELNMIFHFEIVDMDQGPRGKFSPKEWDLPILKTIVNKWQRFMIDNKGWNALYLENHDQGRSVSRWGSDAPEHRVYCAKMFATFLALQSGTVFVYQGQELGMINVPKDRDISLYKDLETLNYWNEIKEKYPNDKELQALTLSEIQKKSRDNARTPMQWTPQKYAGFSTVEPWQKENESYAEINAEAQVGVKDSVFEYWASVLRVRKEWRDVFVYGDFRLVDEGGKEVFAYVREGGGRRALVVCAFVGREVEWSVPEEMRVDAKEVVLSNYGGGLKEVDY